MMLMRLLVLLTLLASGALGFARADTVTVAAAANIKFAMEDIVRGFEQHSGHKLRVSYGSSGNFASQLRHGAPFELFLSADEQYVSRLQEAGVVQDKGVIYAYGRLALVAAKSSPLTLDNEFDGLRQLLKTGELKRFALANPDLAPYGERAKALLQQAGLWDAIKDKLVLGENVSQAAQFAISGSAQGGIVALSLAVAPQFRAKANYLPIPEDQHQPLAQRMVLLPGASAAANAFYVYLQGDEARKVFADYGFSLPPKAHGAP
ncbi:molybdate ABC transporter substrate-binding protein [Shewanella amazonensis]|uniref:Molybdenum ABC transporter, periplasmic molybdenum-binding protein n=1 Tax=Shewanella amazonensis (strain ATCC BAA-1098 / SB2B) TaxID=326297 RepID=A1SBH5_SHEAM|nr:molybdate ABC transporter substrate-binding protein [Shewanella amazonensis]ABM01732.1 molybdenum ABC transporter, periplasmic molybdenum-binding protein [Shewanella amazonensis SB2B]